MIGNAVHVMRIATGEVEESQPSVIPPTLAARAGTHGPRRFPPNAARKSPVRAQRLEPELGFFAPKKNSLRTVVNHFALNAPNDHIGLHHGIGEAKNLLPLTTSLYENVPAFRRRKAAQVLFKVRDRDVYFCSDAMRGRPRVLPSPSVWHLLI